MFYHKRVVRTKLDISVFIENATLLPATTFFCFADIDGIVDHHCLSFLFILNVCYTGIDRCLSPRKQYSSYIGEENKLTSSELEAQPTEPVSLT
jgi:hypothetical protein